MLIIESAHFVIEHLLLPRPLDEAKLQPEALATAITTLARNQKDQKAWGALTAHFTPVLKNLARSLAPRVAGQTADDLETEFSVLIPRIAKSIERTPKERNFKAALIRAAKNKAIDLGSPARSRAAAQAKRTVSGSSGKGDDDQGVISRTAGRRTTGGAEAKELDAAVKKVIDRVGSTPAEKKFLVLWMLATKGQAAEPSHIRNGQPNLSSIQRDAELGGGPAKPKRLLAKFMQDARTALRPHHDWFESVLKSIVEAVFGLDPNSSWLTLEAACDMLEQRFLNG